VLEDDFQPTPATAERLRAYVARGGAVIACHRSGLLEKTEESWLQPFGLSYEGATAFAPAYLVPEARGLGDIPDYEYALYEGATQWRAEAPGAAIGATGRAAFQRSAKRHTSHAPAHPVRVTRRITRRSRVPAARADRYSARAQLFSARLLGFPRRVSTRARSCTFRIGWWARARR